MVTQRGFTSQGQEHLVLGELQQRGGGKIARRYAYRNFSNPREECWSLRAVHFKQWHDVSLYYLRRRKRVRLCCSIQRPPEPRGTCNALPEEFPGGTQRSAENDAGLPRERRRCIPEATVWKDLPTAWGRT